MRERVSVELRPVEPADLEIFFEHQQDPDAADMAAFAPRDRASFMAHWETNVLGNETGVARAVVVDEAVAGNMVSWLDEGDRLVGYWIGKAFWGRGVATRALSLFVHEVADRPLKARVVATNLGSIRVLEKCGFIRVGSDTFLDPDGREREELVLVLDG
jgi:RimJ/RimL family protein N-acetyltransferase